VEKKNRKTVFEMRERTCLRIHSGLGLLYNKDEIHFYGLISTQIRDYGYYLTFERIQEFLKFFWMGHTKVEFMNFIHFSYHRLPISGL
jgi:hypothetical protein